MSREKVGEILGCIDIVVDDSLPEDLIVLHNAKEAVGIKNGVITKVELREDWARESRIEGRKCNPPR